MCLLREGDCLDVNLLGGLLVGVSVLGGTSTVTPNLHENDGDDNNEPVDTVTSDGADGSSVHPAEDIVDEGQSPFLG